jgi:hypothetical protein
MGRWPWQISCPACGADPGFPCTDPVGNILTSHHDIRTDFAGR